MSVPVLSMQSTSIRASPSTAGSSWTRTRRRARRTVADRERERREEHEPLRDHRHGPGHRAGGRPAPVVVHAPLAPRQERGGGDDRPRDVHEDPVDAGSELRAREGEPSRVGSEAGRVGLRSHGGGAVPARPRDHERAGETWSPGSLRTGTASPVSSDSSTSSASAEVTSPSTTIWSPALAAEQVVGHDLGDGDRPLVAVADHAGPRRREHGEPVQRALGPDLLHDPDRGVRDQHQTEQRVLEGPDHEDHDEHRAQQGVEPREHVVAHDPGDRARGGGGDVVRAAGGHPFGHLSRREPAFDVDRHGRSVASGPWRDGCGGSWRGWCSTSRSWPACGSRGAAWRPRPSPRSSRTSCISARILAVDPRVPFRAKVALGVGALWIASPIDLLPEFLPVIGPLDDVIVAALVLRYVVARAGAEVVRERWRGDPATLERVFRAATDQAVSPRSLAHARSSSSPSSREIGPRSSRSSRR